MNAREKYAAMRNRERGSHINFFIKFYDNDGLKTCSVCGCSQIWRVGREQYLLSFVLDHINGDWRDDRPENHRWVCPNCNSLLDTTCRNKNARAPIPKTFECYKLIRSWVREGVARAEIARRLGVGTGAVLWYLVRNGLYHLYIANGPRRGWKI